ncbi:ketopantoate reductase family protein [Lysinibacillus piscis]|uniref:2-dehydropantoate 2-reductase n=1 Tax=Lysinibacillus piscis TaxID=2518931 RepID=A0ABQ5NH08_9BACI|nr:2-dehydropantoate 2-reductase [Lysinibacillus sp. KH24]GLC87563.1 putative 2-dehydropantoate 2-reductase [Lysinibacillus sp. KH24]
MKVAIVGAGAVGQLMASFMAQYGMTVTLVVRRQEQVDALQKQQLTRINMDGTIVTRKIVVTNNLQALPQQDLLIIAVKYSHLQNLYQHLSLIASDCPLLFMQNGLAHFEEVLQLPHQHIAFASALFGAQILNDTTVQHKGIGACQIALGRGEIDKFAVLVQMNNPLLPIVFIENAEQMLFEKAVMNSLINPLTTMLQIKNGELLTNSQAFTQLQTIYQELVHAFPMIEQTIPFTKVVALCEQTAQNTSSMLADRLHGRKSEIDTIVGALLEKALTNGHHLAHLQAIYERILAIEEGREQW